MHYISLYKEMETYIPCKVSVIDCSNLSNSSVKLRFLLEDEAIPGRDIVVTCRKARYRC